MKIYIITNLINFKIYIGKTETELITRFLQHCYITKHNCKMPIVRAIQKYGKENFKIELLTECNNKQELDEWEIMFIHLAKNKNVYPYGCYNIADGGNGGNIYDTLSDEQKIEFKKKCKQWQENLSDEQRMEINNKIKWKNNNERMIKHKSLMSKIHSGIPLSEETKKNIGISKIGNKNMLGKKHTQESKEKMSLSHLNMSEETKKKMSLSALNVSEGTKKKRSKALKGRISPFKGKKLSQEAKNKMSIARKLWWLNKKKGVTL